MEKQKRLRGRPKSFAAKGTENRIQSLDRALEVLDCIAAANGLTLSEIAERLGQSPATVYRILTTFAARNMLEMDATSQEWFIGPASFRAGSAFLRRTGVVERARPVMRDLMEETGETANLGIENNTQVLFLSQVETPENIRAFFPPGAQSPMHASGIGKALLAHSDPRRIAKYISSAPLTAFTDNTIHSKAELLAELEKIKKDGYAFDNEEKNIGMRCIAAPIFNSFGEVVAGISISGPSARLSLERIPSVGAVVAKRAAELSTTLGYRAT
ncbi:MAG TPA: IclR family transcriptional regulator [Rhodobacteraceae bacterium]|nr:IclR family transcriptional regulator [Paracoccaceae bacterium]